MDMKNALKKLQKSHEYYDWKEKYDSYLSYAFMIMEENNEISWQLGFHNPRTDRVTSFVINEKSIEIQKDEEIFKKPETKVNPLEMNNVRLDFDEIIKIAKDFQKQEYPKELINKTIVILQNLKDYENIWNITFVTHALNTINLKVSAIDGKVLHHSIISLMSFAKE